MFHLNPKPSPPRWVGRDTPHREKIAADPEYGEVCRDSRRKWRASHPDYWKQYRENHPAAVERTAEVVQALLRRPLPNPRV